MIFYEDIVRIPVFAENADEATWVAPAEMDSKGVYFNDVDWLRQESVVRDRGVVAGIARSVDYNTVLRQLSTMSSLFANVLAYRNSEKRGGSGGSYPYKTNVTPIGTDFNGEADFPSHIGALSELFSKDKFLFDGEVTTRSINNLAVTTSKLYDEAVTSAKLAVDSVTREKLGSDLIDTGTFTANGITVTLSQNGISGNRGFKIGLSSTAVTKAIDSENAVSSDKIKTSKTSSKNYLLGSLSTVDGESKEVHNSDSVYVTGGNQLNAVSFNSVSDERLKRDIVDLGKNQVKAIVEQVDAKTFSYLTDPKITHVGVVAQDLLKSNTVLGDLLVDKDADGHLSVKESKLVYVLWDYVKQLENRVLKLEEKIEEMENR